MALTPEEFLQKILDDKGSRLNEWFLAECLTPWIEKYGADGFIEFIGSLEEDIEVIYSLRKRFLREREKD